MADDKKNNAESPQSRIETLLPKNIGIYQNPDIISQMQNRARILGQLPNQIIMASSTKNIGSIQKSSNSNSILDKLDSFKDSIDKAKLVYETGLDLFARKNLIYQINEFLGLARKYKYPNLVKKTIGFKNNFLTLGNQEMGEIEKEVIRLNNPSLSKEIEKVKTGYNNFENRIMDGANKTREISILKNSAKRLESQSKFGKKASLGIDIFNSGEFIFKLSNKETRKKLKAGDYVDGGTSILSVFGKIAEFYSKYPIIGKVAGPIAKIVGKGLGYLNPVLDVYNAVTFFDFIPLPEKPKPKPKPKPVMTINPFDTSGLFGNNVIPENARVPSEVFKKIPRNVHGTSYFAGGLSLVGEEGPELVNLPRGSQVHSNSRTQSLVNGMGSGSAGVSVSYSPQIIIQGNADAHVMKEASDKSYADFERKFKALMDRRRRLSFAGGG